MRLENSFNQLPYLIHIKDEKLEALVCVCHPVLNIFAPFIFSILDYFLRTDSSPVAV